MDKQEEKEVKARCLAELREVMPRYKDRLVGIDQRIYDYALDIVRADIDIHCLDEILCFRKFLRLLDTYQFDIDTFKDVLFDAEGEWEIANLPAGTPPKHIRGGLKIEGIYGYGYYRQTRLQVYSYAYIYGFYTWKDTTSPVGSREMMPTEKAGENGTIWDFRRLITNFILFWPRKVAKTFSGAFIQYEGMVNASPARKESPLFEFDYEGYIAANSSDQAKLLFTMLKKFITQFPDYRRFFKINDSPQNRTIAWKGATGIPAFVKALSSNPDNKDGLKASGLSADEIGAANGDSDMERIVNVVEGSRGPRKNPLTVHTSTAGLGIETTYEQMIESEHESLLREKDIPLDGKPHPTPDDWHGAIMLRPDSWERDDDELLRSERVIKKVNPNLGVTIQPSFYEDEWRLADLRGDLKRKEVITKLYNIFAADRAKQWVSGELIRGLFRPLRIEDCTEEEGWQVFAGIDFAMAADLNIVSLLARRRREDGRMQYHAGVRAYMSQEGIDQNSNRLLLRKFAEKGYLNVLTGDEEFYKLPVRAIEDLLNKGIWLVGVGYDPYKASNPINELKDFLFAEFGAENPNICDIVKGVRQNFANFNPAVIEMDYLLRGENGMGHGDDPMITFEANPLWSWCWQNVLLAESSDGMQNRKPIKVSPDQKIDPVIGLLEALISADLSDGKIYDVGADN